MKKKLHCYLLNNFYGKLNKIKFKKLLKEKVMKD